MNKQDRIEQAKTLIRRKGEAMAPQAIANLTFLDKGEVIQLIQAIKNPVFATPGPMKAAPKPKTQVDKKPEKLLKVATREMLESPKPAVVQVEPTEPVPTEPEPVMSFFNPDPVVGECSHMWSKVFNSRRAHNEPGQRRRRKCVDCGEKFSTREVIISSAFHPAEFEFRVDDEVEKVGGDYELRGVVVAAFFKASGEVRYVVEADEPRGLLHIYSDKNLKLIKRYTCRHFTDDVVV